MTKKYACKRSKLLVEGQDCPLHDDCTMTEHWKGRIHFLDASESAIADKLGVSSDGEYAIKVRG